MKVFSGTLTAIITYFVAICSFFACPIIVSVGYLSLGQISTFALKYRIAPEFNFRYLRSGRKEDTYT